MTPQPWQALILETLQELTDVAFQTEVWLRGERPGVVSSPIETVNELYDDSGLGDLLEKGHVFSEPADSTLRSLHSLIHTFDLSHSARFLADPRWDMVRKLAATALAQVREALEAET